MCERVIVQRHVATIKGASTSTIETLWLSRLLAISVEFTVSSFGCVTVFDE